MTRINSAEMADASSPMPVGAALLGDGMSATAQRQTPQTPAEIAAERKHSRQNKIRPEERSADALELIADTLESMRQDVRTLVDAMTPKEG